MTKSSTIKKTYYDKIQFCRKRQKNHRVDNGTLRYHHPQREWYHQRLQRLGCRTQQSSLHTRSPTQCHLSKRRQCRDKKQLAENNLLNIKRND